MTGAAPAITRLSLWSEEEAKVADVLKALDDLRRPEPMPATRTSVLTLVIVASTLRAARRATHGVHELGGRHPGRVLTLVLDRSTRSQHPGAIDATIELFGSEAEGHPVWFEDVHLDVRGPVIEHLDSLVEPFTIPDLPVVVWFVDALPEAGDPMLRAADVVLVDARDFGDTDCFEALSALCTMPVVDLSWQRLRPWRELLASLFEPDSHRPFLDDIRAVRISGRTGPRHLLGGWLIDRLQIDPRTVDLAEAEHVSMEIVAADDDGTEARFEVTRPTDERLVTARARVTDGPAVEAVVPLPEATPAWGLAAALSRLHRDPIFELALLRAIDLAGG